ncbi:hypothetical protein ATEIFO6365_0012035800 [Aspergillus terreus]|uniref:DUF7728 domain-containing protein n=1 Tax=Aspergillus terreus TaxID=33178 RepID=A0A5M3ZC67_ASPTE|nr:hypothetical protein ATETN484_0013036800 [Aspergillus terreus]GFF20602.1 hypothetical protein ATEIFO6365_0012035800 [Aspergillus terreus]
MNLRTFLLGSVVALGAKAFLVVPDVEVDAIATPDEGAFSDLHPFDAHVSQRQNIDLLCSECPFREVGRHGKVHWTDGYQTSLSLNFSIDNGFLLANGHQIFPPPPPTLITAIQRRLSDGEESEPIPLGYAVEMTPLPSPPEEPLDMVEVRFTVLDLDGHPVPLDTVAISLIHDMNGNLYMAKTDIEETTPDRISWKQCRGKPRCLRRLLFDRMRALFAAAKARMLGLGRKPSGCGGRPHHPPHPDGFAPDRMSPEDMDRMADGPGRPHHHHHNMHHFHHAKWRHTFARMVRFIVVPAILGVSAGLTASALGMLVGQTLVYLWQRYRRSGRQESVERGDDSEKEALIADDADDLPPAYNDDESHIEELPADKN